MLANSPAPLNPRSDMYSYANCSQYPRGLFSFKETNQCQCTD